MLKKCLENLDTGGEAYSGYYAFSEWRGADREAKALVKKVYEQYNGSTATTKTNYFCCTIMGDWMNHKKVHRLMQTLENLSQIRWKHSCNYASSTEVVWRKIC
ncbi:hypothetical protein [Paenibacillus polymyxa]|uniref:hypothetical protein n=1 Tax=Paenibacillus polymyxa TaxID=1406 RepID=UPI000AEEB675|nr:hypothetical protein [Paenibacillus polymyxa]